MSTAETDEISRLKDTLYENYKLDENNEQFNKLLTNKELSSELLQTLILLHSSYRTDLLNLRQFNFRSLNQILDVLIARSSRHTTQIENLDKRVAILESKRDNKLHTYLTYVIMGVLILFIMFSSNEKAAQGAIDGIKTIMPFLDKDDKDSE